MEVLEHHDDRSRRREPLEERPPGSEELLRAGPGLDTQESEKRRLDPLSLFSVRHVGRERLGHLDPGRRIVVGLQEASPAPDHLAERPEADPVAVCRAPSVMPPGGVDEAIDVLEELPREPSLADPARADDAHQPGPVLATGRMEQLLEQAQLVVAADEWSFQHVRPIATADLGNHPDGPPRGHRGCLALEHLIAGGHELDGLSGGSLGRLADEDGAWLGRGLKPACRVDEVAGDHPLADRPERDRRLAGQDSGPGLDPWAEPLHRVDELKAGPNGSLGVILVGRRCAPDRHDRITDELLDRSPVAADDLARQVEVAREQLASVLGVAALRERREPDQIGEHDRHESAFGDGWQRGFGGSGLTPWTGAGGRSRERRGALAAELGRGRVRGAAARAAGCQPRGALHTELAPRIILRPAARADHLGGFRITGG